MAKIIGVIQLKGGAGRSTLATNLAGELSKIGPTVLIDCDSPQWTASSWAALRESGGLFTGLVAETASNHQELVRKVEQHQDAQFIVLDGPPRVAELTRAMLVMADLSLIPIGASPAEVWATTDILALIKEAKKVKKGILAKAVWTRHRGHLRLAQELTEQAQAELGIDPMATTMGLRVSYVDALGSGLTVAETSDREARQEIHNLVEEVTTLLERKR